MTSPCSGWTGFTCPLQELPFLQAPRGTEHKLWRCTTGEGDRGISVLHVYDADHWRRGWRKRHAPEPKRSLMPMRDAKCGPLWPKGSVICG
jgi:hypothetical protein